MHIYGQKVAKQRSEILKTASFKRGHLFDQQLLVLLFHNAWNDANHKAIFWSFFQNLFTGRFNFQVSCNMKNRYLQIEEFIQKPFSKWSKRQFALHKAQMTYLFFRCAKHFYKRVCPSVGPSVRWSFSLLVCPSVRHTFVKK